MLTLNYVLGKSASKLPGLHTVVRLATVELIERSYRAGVPIVITQGLRTIAEQDALYAQGRTKPGQIVTNAKGGYSNHNFGVAIDFALLLPDGKSVSWNTLRDGNLDLLPDWSQVVDIAKALGFAWGGDWRSFKDLPHFEMTFGLTTAQYRAGKKPSEIAMAKAMAIIDKEVDEVTRAEYDALDKRIASTEAKLKEVPAPAWFVKEFADDKVLEFIQGDGKTTPVKTGIFWEALAVSLRLQGMGNGRGKGV